jgi:hypothetical protein
MGKPMHRNSIPIAISALTRSKGAVFILLNGITTLVVTAHAVTAISKALKQILLCNNLIFG